MKRIFLLIAFVFSFNFTFGQVSIIPKPASLILGESNFKIDGSTKIFCNTSSPEIQSLAELISSSVKSVTGSSLEKTDDKDKKNSIHLLINNSIKDDEAYNLMISPDQIILEGKSGAGIFYAIQSLMQLFPTEKTSQLILPCLTINDNPRFKWRGVHLDVCRHFFPIEFIKKYIDILAFYKINTFHWHLTEDQGWRIEIKKYPRLTEIGAWRKETMGDNKPYGGYYTQEQIKEVVDYAKQKYINVVPEIELPGHSLAALAAYPEYSCTGGPFNVGTIWGIYEDVYCAGNEGTFNFLENILSEVIELFPSEFIHIGGDEVPKTRWKECEKCQARINAENLKDEHELQSYFVTRIEKFLNSKGKRIIGWDEILEGGLAPNAAVMSWRGIDGGVAAAKMNHDVVMSPGTHCYFDHYQALSGEPKAIGGFTSLEKVYSYEPIPESLNDEEGKYILGAQANMWTEYMETTSHVEYMLLPRLCALSEVVWSPKQSRDLNDFLNRMKKHYQILSKKDYNFRIPQPINENGECLLKENESIKLSCPIDNSKIYYTLDGTEPSENSKIYTEPLIFFEPAVLKAISVIPDGRKSTTSNVYVSIIDTAKNGLVYKYYEGNWNVLPGYSELSPQKTGRINKLSLDQINHRSDYFGLEFSGFVKIPKTGVYNFFLVSDDGSKLLINDEVLIDNDGLHGSKEVLGKIFLEAGKYPLKIFYFDKIGSHNLKIEFEGPGIKRRLLTADMLFFD